MNTAGLIFSVELQNVIVLSIVLAALIYTVWSVIKSIRVKETSGCGGNCSCSAKSDIHKALLKHSKGTKSKHHNLLVR